jgi:hypothetical protein
MPGGLGSLPAQSCRSCRIVMRQRSLTEPALCTSRSTFVGSMTAERGEAQFRHNTEVFVVRVFGTKGSLN